MLLTTFMLLGTALAEYTLREVGSRNTQVRLLPLIVAKKKIILIQSGMAHLAGKRGQPRVILARHSSIPQRISTKHYQHDCRNTAMDRRQD